MRMLPSKCNSLLPFLLLFGATNFLVMIDAHAGFISPPSMMIGKKFRQQCGRKTFGVLRKDPFIRRESWAPGSGCAERKCQGAFVEDQNLSKVPKFKFGEEIEVTIRIQISHGGPAQIFLMDVKNQKQGVQLVDLGDFGTPTSAKIQKIKLKLPEKDADTANCTEAGTCALAFNWLVQEKEVESYEVCALITLKDR